MSTEFSIRMRNEKKERKKKMRARRARLDRLEKEELIWWTDKHVQIFEV
jgi:hypothetical protein